MKNVTVELGLTATMRDGVSLVANLYRPDAQDQRWPTLLMRTPYDIDSPTQMSWIGFDPVQVARAGFVVVVQQVRGRFASEGDWEPYVHEASDGYDSIEWAAQLASSNGSVGTFGASYCGSTQLLAALESPPSLRAIAPGHTWSEPMDGLMARGGALEWGLALRWALENGHDAVVRRNLPVGETAAALAALDEEHDQVDIVGYYETPTRAAELLRRHGITDLGALDGANRDRLAEGARIAGRHQGIKVPAIHTTGWYDNFLQGTIDNFLGGAGSRSRLIVGPWTHQTFADPIGDIRFGQHSARHSPALGKGRSWTDTHLDWFRSLLVQNSPGPPEIPPVRIFVMGRNEWRDENEWPLERAVEQRWYLTSDGSVTHGSPRGVGTSQFVTNANDPVPTLGGNGVGSITQPLGPVDQTPIERREDVLTFTSAPLRAPLEVTGPVSAHLTVATEAQSSDWVVRLCDVHPDGRSINLCDGIVRVSKPLEHGQQIAVDMWSTSNMFREGHRIRVHVTGSSFPRWDRNPYATDAAGIGIRQQLDHSETGSCWLSLQVVADDPA